MQTRSQILWSPTQSPILSLDDPAWVLVRASNATYQSGARSLLTAGNNVLRKQDRSNGNGPLVLLEDAITNLFVHRQPSSFSNPAGPVINALGGTSLLDGRTQDIVEWTSDFQIFDFAAASFAAAAHTQSFWLKFLCGTWADFVVAADTSTLLNTAITDSPTDWTYYTQTHTYPATQNGNQVYRDDTTTSTFNTIIDGHQIEERSYATSYVDVSGAQASRNADEYVIAAGSWPDMLSKGSYSLPFAPLFASTEEPGTKVLMSFGGANNELRWNGGSDVFEVHLNGTLRASSAACTFSRDQLMRARFDFLRRTIELLGATTGNGIVAIGGTDLFPENQPLRLGGRHGTNTHECNAAYGHFER